MSSYYAGAIDFRTAGGTAATSSLERSPDRDSPTSMWLASPKARPYEGQWVMLNDQFEPIDADLSPLALGRRHEPVSSNLSIVFVRPTSVQIGA